MAVTYAGSGVGTLSGSGTSVTCDIAAGGTSDVVILVAYTDVGGAINVPSGWTALSTEVDIDGANARARAFYKTFTSSSSTTQAVTCTNTVTSASGEIFKAISWRYSGVNTAAAVPEIATRTFSGGFGTSTTHNTVTIGDGNWSVLFGYLASSIGKTPPSGWTEDYDNTTWWASHREYTTGASTGSVSTTHSSTFNRIGWAIEIAAEAAQAVVANHIASGASVKNHTVTPGQATVVANHLGPVGSVKTPGVQPGDISVVANHIASGAVVRNHAIVVDYQTVAPSFLTNSATLFSPAVQTGAVSIATNLISTTALHSPGVILGAAIDMHHLGPTSALLTHAVTAGNVVIATTFLAPGAVLFAPGPLHQELRTNHLGPTSALHEPTTVAFITGPSLQSGSVYAPLIGSFVVLEEPDETIWGASGGFSARVDFLDAAGNTIASSDDPHSRVVLVGGSVNEDETQEVKRSCDLRLLLASSEDGTRHPLLPAKPGDPLDPRTGGKVAVYAGPVRPSGEADYTKLGVFKISSVSATSKATGDSLTVRGLSQEAEIKAAGFWQVEIIPAGTRIVDALLGLVVEAIPDVELTAESSPVTTTEISYSDSDDRLKAVYELARAIAMDVEFDREGVFRVHKNAAFGDAADQTPRWTFTEGERATVRDVTRQIDDSTLYNGVIVIGEPLDTNEAPFRAEVWDTRPTSPVYYDPNNPGASLTGPRPKKIVSNLITSYQQAEQLAAVELARVLAFPDRISVDIAAQPKIEKDDVVRVVRTTMGVDALYLVESVTHDLLGGASQAVCVAL